MASGASPPSAIALKPAGYRVLGTLCGTTREPFSPRDRQKGPRCSQQGPRVGSHSARNWLARGIGNYYIAALGGGQDAAIADIKKAIEIDPKLADAYLWLRVSLRKAHRNAEARQAFQKSLELNPRRVWAKEQLDKTPAA